MMSPVRIRVATWSLTFTLAMVTLVGRAEASILMALDLPDLVKQAEHIAVVEVLAVRAAWDDRHERIYSTIELKVVENWKPGAAGAPAAPQRLTIVQAGGTVGDVSMTVFGQGTFSTGERSLVFLRGPAQRAQVVGMTQGKRPLRYESTARRWLVAPPNLGQTKLVRPTGTTAPPSSSLVQSSSPAQSPVIAPAPAAARPAPIPAREMPLDDLRVEVRRLLGTSHP